VKHETHVTASICPLCMSSCKRVYVFQSPSYHISTRTRGGISPASGLDLLSPYQTRTTRAARSVPAPNKSACNRETMILGSRNLPGILLPHSFPGIVFALQQHTVSTIQASHRFSARPGAITTYRQTGFHHKSIMLVELTYHRLSLCEPSTQKVSQGPIIIKSRQRITPLVCLVPTFNICKSFKPFCTSSCTCRGSSTFLCSRKASLVRRLAYSRKL